MSDFTQHWHWPQWVLLALLFLRFAWASSHHGKQKLETAGDEKGQPQRYNGFSAVSSFVIWMAILICGGFFA